MGSKDVVPVNGQQGEVAPAIDRQDIFSTLMMAVLRITEQEKPLSGLVEDYFLLANSEEYQGLIVPTEADPNEQLAVFDSTYVDILLEDLVSFHRIDLADKVYDHYSASAAGQHRPIHKHWRTRA